MYVFDHEQNFEMIRNDSFRIFHQTNCISEDDGCKLTNLGGGVVTEEKVKKGTREILISCESGSPNISKLICRDNQLFLSKKDKEPVSSDIEIICGSGSSKACSTINDFSKLFKKVPEENFQVLNITETASGSTAQLECKLSGYKYEATCQPSKKKPKVKLVGSKAEKKNFNNCK
ncbi:Oidioi.mRNA.OKI2018_I69.chr2.g4939.t1.cds [Oikopleura dioica]|uniref:Oidioi.mRNA.OKI2018_I69.chr2.g4939.t1.cds n=1 Tax=Oikopleura dioica TaxID=34765 RepID=A0ABN7SZB7_OIKDI|nr:Oidioi.mRNA.OKI2018_I69.chr2.g4939.t1.cds [Oikopleura dioica]